MFSLLFREGIKIGFETVLALGDGSKGVFFVAGERKADFLFVLSGVGN